MDVWGLYEGISPDTPNKVEVLCGRFIEKVSQMDGTQLAHFLRDYSFEGFNVSLTFHIPFTEEFVNGFLRETERDGRDVPRDGPDRTVGDVRQVAVD